MEILQSQGGNDDALPPSLALHVYGALEAILLEAESRAAVSQFGYACLLVPADVRGVVETALERMSAAHPAPDFLQFASHVSIKYIQTPAALRAFAAHLHRLAAIAQPSAASGAYNDTASGGGRAGGGNQPPAGPSAAPPLLSAEYTLPSILAFLCIDEMCGVTPGESDASPANAANFPAAPGISMPGLSSRNCCALREVEKCVAILQSAVAGWSELLSGASSASGAPAGGGGGEAVASGTSAAAAAAFNAATGAPTTSAATFDSSHAGPRSNNIDRLPTRCFISFQHGRVVDGGSSRICKGNYYYSVSPLCGGTADSATTKSSAVIAVTDRRDEDGAPAATETAATAALQSGHSSFRAAYNSSLTRLAARRHCAVRPIAVPT